PPPDPPATPGKPGPASKAPSTTAPAAAAASASYLRRNARRPRPGDNHPMPYPARCPARHLNGRMCPHRPGHDPNHPGYGTCSWTKGAHRHAEEAWAMAQAIAAERNITPHEALLGLVRTATGRAAYVDTIITERLRDHVDAGGDPLKPPEELLPWLRQSR